jgi:hypothetical protein
MITIELERAAYISNDPTAALLARIADLEAQNETLAGELEDHKNGTVSNPELEDLREFFRECFLRLPGGAYPAPSVFSDYDKSVIFDAIEKSEP